MNRRDALRSLGTLASATGIRLTPVTERDATDVTLVILRTPRLLSLAATAALIDHWQRACAGTPLEGVKTAVFADGLDVEFVRGRS